nr:hypothetical protein [uncultured bacterium]
MTAIDVSRLLFQPEKRYSGLLRLQGRALLASDENDRQFIDNHLERLTQAETVCAKGSPNDGFLAATVTVAADESYDIDFAAGSIYVGGIRFEAGEGETLQGQLDWLQIAEDGGIPNAPSAADLAGGPRYDLCWLEGWEQCVSSREDGETLDQALGGPDTAVRLRPMRRMRVDTDIGDTCRDAFADLIADLTASGAAEVDSNLCRLTGTTRLLVGFEEDGTDEDLCAPARQRGYLGCQNDVIRVRIIAPGVLAWSLMNAAPLYRVRAVAEGGALTRIEMITPPWDQYSQPIAGDLVEILRWEARLDNDTKIAGETGHMTVVAQSFDPTDLSFGIDDPVPQPWQDWLAAADGGQLHLNDKDPAGAETYFYMRLWRGEVHDPGNAGQPFVPGTPVALGTTGLHVTLDGPGAVGDTWVFDVRANTPQDITPWDFTRGNGALPIAPARYLAPLALIEWRLVGAVAVPTIHDCRHRFRALCSSDCCEVTVGDGTTSFGDAASISEALTLLPDDGGKICLLPGQHRDHALIDDRTDILIEGCGPTSLLLAGEGAAGPVITIRDSLRITLRNFRIRAPEEIGVLVTASAPVSTGPETALTRDILIERMRLTARDAPAVVVESATHFALRRSRIGLMPLEADLTPASPAGRAQAVSLLGTDLAVEDCEIVPTQRTGFLRRPMGGIHVRGDVTEARINRNRIEGGSGMGIRLGSWRLVASGSGGSGRSLLPEPRYTPNTGWGEHRTAVNARAAETGIYHADTTIDIIRTDAGCFRPGIIVTEIPGIPADIVEPVADGPITGLRIDDNDIADMALTGIGATRFFDLDQTSQAVEVIDLALTRNRISNCQTSELPELTPALTVHAGFGGVALGIVRGALVAQNRIADCGGDRLDPTCGFFALMTEGCTIEQNTITGNGRRLEFGDVPRLGRRGGIVLGLAIAQTFDEDFGLPDFAPEQGLLFNRQTGEPALRIHANIVEQPEGQALRALVAGPALITDNNFASRGAVALLQWVLAVLAGLGGANTGGNATTATDSLTIAANVDPAILAAAQVDVFEALLNVLGGVTVSVVNLTGGSIEDGPSTLGLVAALSGLDTLDLVRDPGLPLISGEIMFTDNQVFFDSIALPLTLALCSVSLASADDVEVNDNQLRLDLGFDIIHTHLFAVSESTLRVIGNRMREPGPTTQISAHTRAPVNTTALNQGDHCFYVVAEPQTRIHHRNLTTIGGGGDADEISLCAEINRQAEDEGADL